MKAWSLLGLRISMGWLLVVWGADKIFNTEHGIAVAEKYYFGLMASEVILPFAGILAVATSVIDPWGWYLDGSNALFYPSLIIFAASVLLIAFMNEDRFCVDAKRLESQSAG